MRTFVVLILLSIISSLSFSQEERRIIREGNKSYENKDYDKALSKFAKAYKMKPEQNELLNNIAASQYRNGIFKDAGATYENVLKMSGTRKEKADAFYNIGNSYLQAADYKKSVEAYQNALRLNPNHDLSRYNMAVATKIQQQQQQQQQQQGEDQNQDNQNQDEQNQDNQDKNEDNKDKNQDKQDNKENKNEDKQKNEQQQSPQNKMSREEMERFLESLQQQEKDVQEKVNKEKFKAQQRVVEKEW